MKRLVLLMGILVIAIVALYAGSRMLATNPTVQESVKNSPLLNTLKRTKDAITPQNIPPFEKEIKMPPGFKMYVYAQVKDARSMALGEDGTVYVGNRSGTDVYALPDKNGDGEVDNVVTVARGLKQPNGIAYKDGSLYVADNTTVKKFENIDGTLDNPTSKTIYEGYISDVHHQWKYAAFGPDGKLYIALGAPCDSCEPKNPYGTIARMNDDGTNLEVIARGVRNSVGFDWHPDTNELWFTDNGRDNLGDDTPPDELNHITGVGQQFGFPYCYGTDVPDPVFGSKNPCNAFVPPVVNLDPHAAALGMKFYRGAMFPSEYKNSIFIAQHGSWNRSNKIGYRVLVLKPNASGTYDVSPFAEGWLKSDGTTIGRPVDILELKDGSLLISDDAEGLIYRVVYQS